MTNFREVIEILAEVEALLDESDPKSREARAASKVREARHRAQESRDDVLRALGEK